MTGVMVGLLAVALGGPFPGCSAPAPPTPRQLVDRADAIIVVKAPADYNRGLVPYQNVRRDGEGPCVARTYRPGAHYLLLLKSLEGALTPSWAALAPTNEQLVPPFRQDPWFRWVRREVRSIEVGPATEARAAAPVQQDAWEAADAATTRLPPSAFPELPDEVARQLDARGCSIPQGDWPRDPDQRGVVEGEFLAAGKRSWAVLCSVERVSAILVFDSANELVAELNRAPDREYLQGGGHGTVVYSRLVTRATPAYIRDHYEEANDGVGGMPEVSHDGIDDGWEGKASTVLYFTGSEWISLPGAD